MNLQFDSVCHVMASVAFLVGSEILQLLLFSGRIAEGVAFDVEMFPDDQLLYGSLLKGRDRVLDAETVLARVLADLVKVGC